MYAWAREQLKRFGVDIDPRATIGSLSPAQRQFIEIVKALLSNPKVLLLDEPTSTLDIDGVRKLMGLVRELTAAGTGVVYVSHRLPEILELAQRVTILSDGVHQGTFPITAEVSEHQLVSLMVGRDIDSEYPPKSASISDRVVLSVRGLSGEGFSDVSFEAHAGEILGLAGSGRQRPARGDPRDCRPRGGSGQRHLPRRGGGRVLAEGGAREAASCSSAPTARAKPIFPDLGVQKNMMLSASCATSRVSASSRVATSATAPSEMVSDFTVVTASLDKPISGLSGGNQQKAVLARSFRAGANAVLIDEPTQGVDAGARFEIYKAVRENIREDGTCVVNSSDAQELAGICDRVLVFSRGKIVRELQRRRGLRRGDRLELPHRPRRQDAQGAVASRRAPRAMLRDSDPGISSMAARRGGCRSPSCRS